MGAVAERCEILLSDAKTFLRVVHDAEDALINGLIDSALQLADEYLNNPFTDATGAAKPIPATVRQWCCTMIADGYANRTNRLHSETVSGVGGTEFWADVNYSLIEKYRLNPGL
jgi:hypothetical protein